MNVQEGEGGGKRTGRKRMDEQIGMKRRSAFGNIFIYWKLADFHLFHAACASLSGHR